MVDVSEKPVTAREARASGRVFVSSAAMAIVRRDGLPKGSVVEVARLAGIQAAKRTSDVIPLCHSLLLSSVDVAITPEKTGFRIKSIVRTIGQTGAEMEALHAVAVAALTIYDMVKAVDKRMVVGEITLESKKGGRSGDFKR